MFLFAFLFIPDFQKRARIPLVHTLLPSHFFHYEIRFSVLFGCILFPPRVDDYTSHPLSKIFHLVPF